jgi:hypothetical protein
MVPDHIFIMRAFPLTANGKVDLSALPLPSTASETPAPVQTPRTGVEGEVADAVADVLGIAAPPLDSRFFDLGCTSVQIVRILVRLARMYPQLGISDLFANPTVRSLSAFLEGHPSEDPVAAGLRRAALRNECVRRNRF